MANGVPIRAGVDSGRALFGGGVSSDVAPGADVCAPLRKIRNSLPRTSAGGYLRGFATRIELIARIRYEIPYRVAFVPPC